MAKLNLHDRQIRHCGHSWQKYFSLVAFVLLLHPTTTQAQQGLHDTTLLIRQRSLTLDQLLALVSGQSGYFFIYASGEIPLDRKVGLQKGPIGLATLLPQVLSPLGISYRVEGKHILLYRADSGAMPRAENSGRTDSLLTIRGKVVSGANKEALPFASIGVKGTALGSASNQDGRFALHLPARFADSGLWVSYVGYRPALIPISLALGKTIEVELKPQTVSIPEVVIRYADADKLIARMLATHNHYVPFRSVCITSYYREGVKREGRTVSYAEAVMQVIQPARTELFEKQQVKVLKSRKLINANPQDTVYVKLKAGVESSLHLDLLMYLPDFLSDSRQQYYQFAYRDIVQFDGYSAYVIEFVQRPGIAQPLYKGQLYIAEGTYQLLGADFQINPDFIQLKTDDLIQRKNRNLRVKLHEVVYSVKYAPVGSHWVLNQARCGIQLSTRLRNHLHWIDFAAYSDFVTCQVDTLAVPRFGRSETLSPERVFSDVGFPYDADFWGSNNFILPEAELELSLRQIIGRLEIWKGDKSQ